MCPPSSVENLRKLFRENAYRVLVLSDNDAAVVTTQAHRGVASVRARARRSAMRRARARGGDTRARSASLVLAAATLACLASADAFSIGIDLGAESTTVAASRSGGSARDVSVVPDDRGGRSSPSLVGFTERHAARVLGADAESLRATCPRCVFSDPRSLVGVPLSALRDAFGAKVAPSLAAARAALDAVEAKRFSRRENARRRERSDDA